MTIWCNGDWLEDHAPALSAGDRGFSLGDGLFETMLWQAGALKHCARHAARLSASAAALDLPAPPGADALADIARDVIARNRLHNGRAAVRASWSAGPGPRGLLRPAMLSPTLIVSAAPSPAPPEPVSLVSTNILRNETAPTARHKTLSYLDNIIARGEAASAGADEALLCNTKGALAGGSMSNLFLVIGGRVRTPGVEDGALPGIARAVILDAGLEIAVGAIAQSELQQIEAAAITNALNPWRAAKSLDGRALNADHGLFAPLRAAARA